MHTTITDALSAHFDTYSIDRRLHAVPPHAVYAVTVDGQRAILKIDSEDRGTAAYEGRVMAAVDERTPVPVPSVLAVGDSSFVATWHPNAPAPDEGQPVDEDWARGAGRVLATLHDETADWTDRYGRLSVPATYLGAHGDLGGHGGHGDHGDHGDLGGHGDHGDQHTGFVLLPFAYSPSDRSLRAPSPTIGAARASWHAAALESIRAVRPVAAANDMGDLVDDVVAALETHPDAFVGAGESVCCHGWATPEHLAVADGTATCLLDFEHAVAAPAEYDYWRTVIPAFDDDTAAERRAFHSAYETIWDLPDGLARREPWYRLLIGVQYVESLYVQSQHDTETTQARADWLHAHITQLLDQLD